MREGVLEQRVKCLTQKTWVSKCQRVVAVVDACDSSTFTLGMNVPVGCRCQRYVVSVKLLVPLLLRSGKSQQVGDGSFEAVNLLDSFVEVRFNTPDICTNAPVSLVASIRSGAVITATSQIAANRRAAISA